MFTGIIEETGRVKNISQGENSSRLVIEGNKIFQQIQLGDSVAVNGVCLTVCNLSNTVFEADVMRETLSRSSLGNLKQGSIVNLERAMEAEGQFGGHIVSGHIDGTGTIVRMRSEGIAMWIRISTSPGIMKYIVEKGSIAMDGVSLTVARVQPDSFEISLIPHTWKGTALRTKTVGDVVNLENDIIGKYVEKLLHLKDTAQENKNSISMEFLIQNGF
ncbi:riboflavin synthase [Aminipila luticellarii]|uniref:Riboflavin synthase n=1 Tax=Aminipila luticellarii TaxID=2507160 RepID=A0A410PW11_9FIRM|nr:riboflavin synthase [Aminipila luticellarii]QAT43105.1 riboflavin synthase [Aminipila luticellarii]